MVSALFFVYGCSDISDSPPHSYVSDDNIQTVDFIYDINRLGPDGHKVPDGPNLFSPLVESLRH